MNGGYYTPGPERALRVRALFDRIAPRYDLINDLQSFGLHRIWKRRLLEIARAREGILALDVCCGTGDIAQALKAAGAQVVGCDFSRSMLGVALQRDAAGHYVQADALALPFPDRSFELITIGYGLRNLADLHAGCAELLRVLKPGGRLVILDFGKPQNVLWRTFYFAYLRLIVPLFGLLFCGDAAAYSYILASLEKYPAQEGVAGAFREMGCETVEVYNFLGGIMSIHCIGRERSLR